MTEDGGDVRVQVSSNVSLQFCPPGGESACIRRCGSRLFCQANHRHNIAEYIWLQRIMVYTELRHTRTINGYDLSLQVESVLNTCYYISNKYYCSSGGTILAHHLLAHNLQSNLNAKPLFPLPILIYSILWIKTPFALLLPIQHGYSQKSQAKLLQSKKDKIFTALLTKRTHATTTAPIIKILTSQLNLCNLQYAIPLIQTQPLSSLL
jgi:hypothetical protein